MSCLIGGLLLVGLSLVSAQFPSGYPQQPNYGGYPPQSSPYTPYGYSQPPYGSPPVYGNVGPYGSASPYGAISSPYGSQYGSSLGYQDPYAALSSPYGALGSPYGYQDPYAALSSPYGALGSQYGMQDPYAALQSLRGLQFPLGGPGSPFGLDGLNGDVNADPMAAFGQKSLLGGMTNFQDSNRNGIADYLEATKGKIDDYLAKTQLLGNRKLSVQVDYLNTPLEYQYLNQYHGFQHPLSGTPLGTYFNIPTPPPPQQFQPQIQNQQSSQQQQQQQQQQAPYSPPTAAAPNYSSAAAPATKS
jgi:hypothetical protein